jgi:hypothetical protein
LWRSGAFGLIGLRLSILGAIALALGAIVSEWFRNDAGWGLIMLGLLAYTIGMFLFGLANLKARVLVRLNALPLVVSLFGMPVPIALSFFVSDSSDLPWQMMLAALGGGWLLLGALLLRSQTPEERGDLES